MALLPCGSGDVIGMSKATHVLRISIPYACPTPCLHFGRNWRRGRRRYEHRKPNQQHPQNNAYASCSRSWTPP
jgi:hypothetical protein